MTITVIIQERRRKHIMAGSFYDPRKRKKLTIIICIVLVLAMVVPTILSLVLE